MIKVDKFKQNCLSFLNQIRNKWYTELRNLAYKSKNKEQYSMQEKFPYWKLHKPLVMDYNFSV